MRQVALAVVFVAALAALLVAEDPKPDKAPQVAVFGAGTRAPEASEKTDFKLGSPLAGRVNGQIVEGVDKDGPAATAGIVAGDAILALDENRIYSNDDLQDFVRTAKPEQKVKVLLRRAESKEEETVEVTLGAGPAAEGAHIDWTFAGPAQLDAALALAKKEGKKLLVGLSGAETWWGTTRFESGSLSEALDDAEVVKASEAFVRIIIRRPHAYAFASAHDAAPIPGLSFLTADGKRVGGFPLGGDPDVKALLEEMKAQAK